MTSSVAGLTTGIVLPPDGVAPLAVDQQLLATEHVDPTCLHASHVALKARCAAFAASRYMLFMPRVLTIPVNFGVRFSRFAAIPSFASSLWNSSCCSSRSIARPSPKPASRPDCTARLMRPTARLALCGGVNCSRVGDHRVEERPARRARSVAPDLGDEAERQRPRPSSSGGR